MIQVANAPCSWGVIENIEGERITYKQVLDEMQATGYAGTELGDWGFMPTDPARLADELNARHLKLLGSWVNVYLHDAARHEESIADCVRTGKLLAAVGGDKAFVILGNDPYIDPMRTKRAGRIRPEDGMSAAQWDTFARGANRVAKAIRDETGLCTIFHHHVGTWVETPAETKRLMEMTDPQLLGLVFDTGHWTFAGGDAVEGLKQHADRIWHVHFKDCNQKIADQSRAEGWDGPTSLGHGVFSELGKGDVDFPAVLNQLRAMGYDGWIVVEQDVLPGMGTPRESAQRNREYLRSIGI
ncbi:MAG TPA: TIM barrel protein [Anaerolineae bacterium]|nr:TIM barrel protein [Anaerolineae bacterium]